MSMPIFESPRQSRGLLFNFLLGMGINSKKCLKIGISNSYFSTRISSYCPMYMPIFESPRQKGGLLFNFFSFYGNMADNPLNPLYIVFE